MNAISLWAFLVVVVGAGAPARAALPDTTARAAAAESTASDTAGHASTVPGPALTGRAADPSLQSVPISEIVITTRNIYDPVPPGRLAPAYRLANRLHVRTRRRTVHEHLLFEVGKPWSEAKGRETERNLRALDFLTPERIDAQPRGDSAAVTVVTRDFWTTSPEFNLEGADGRQYGSIAFTERNLLGLGKSVSITYREDPSGISRSAEFEDPSVLSSRVRLRYSAASGVGGASDQLSVGVPFYAEDTPFSYGLTWNRSTSAIHLFQSASEVATVDQRLAEAEVFWGEGERRPYGIRRLTTSFLIKDRRFGPSRLLLGAPPEFAGGDEDLHLRRLAQEGRIWRPRFIARTRVNRMGPVEDFDVGASVALKLGFAPGFLGSTAHEGYARFGGSLGAAPGRGFGWVRGSVTSRLRRDARDAVSQIEARWIDQSIPGQTVALAAFGTAGFRTARDFEVVVGGLNGLRAYPVQGLAGKQLWRLNAEDRWTIGDYEELVTIGAVVFTDAARTWGAGSAGADWHVASGVGLRIALPRWSLTQVLRIDLAWPVSPSRDRRRNAVVSIGSSQAF